MCELFRMDIKKHLSHQSESRTTAMGACGCVFCDAKQSRDAFPGSGTYVGCHGSGVRRAECDQEVPTERPLKGLRGSWGSGLGLAEPDFRDRRS